MNFILKSIQCHGVNNSIVIFTLYITYGYKNDMFKDKIQINYNGNKKTASISVPVKNPGIGTVVTRLIDDLKNISEHDAKAAPLKIAEILSDSFEVELDTNFVASCLEPYLT